MKLKDLPVSLGSKLVGSQVREWGRSVHSSSHTNLVRRYKLNDKWTILYDLFILIINDYSSLGKEAFSS